jgi:hypothetical protein
MRRAVGDDHTTTRRDDSVPCTRPSAERRRSGPGLRAWSATRRRGAQRAPGRRRPAAPDADPALDLVAAWHLFDVGPRQVLRAGLGSGDLEWARCAARALQQALGVGWYYLDSNPAMSAMGLRTLERLVPHPPAMP